MYDLEQPESRSPNGAETRSKCNISIDMDRIPDAYLSGGMLRGMSYDQYLMLVR